MAHRPSSRRTVLALGLGAVAMLGGCVVVPAGRRHAGPGGGGGGYGAPGPDVDDEGPVVMVAPPAVQVEVMPVMPGPGYFWIGGYWTWRAGRHVWIGGRWESARPGRVWVPHAWRPYGRGWREVPGHWRRH